MKLTSGSNDSYYSNYETSILLLIISAKVEVSIMISGLLMFLKSFK